MAELFKEHQLPLVFVVPSRKTCDEFKVQKFTECGKTVDRNDLRSLDQFVVLMELL